MNRSGLKTSFIVWTLLTCLMSCGQEMPQVGNEGCATLFPPADTVIVSHTAFTQKHYQERISSFKRDTLKTGDVVMLGNSLTEQGRNWGDRFGLEKVKNRGIAGDNAYGVMARLDEIICAEPSKVFLMIGTNDLWLNDSPETIADNIVELGHLLSQSVHTQVYVQTIMPVEAGHDKTEKINRINELLRMAESDDFVLLDTFDAMSDDSGVLLPALTTDGVHLTSSGYDQWTDFLKPFVIND